MASLLLTVLLLLAKAVGASVDGVPRYSAECHFSLDHRHSANIPCQLSLFSYFNFRVDGSIDIASDDMCSDLYGDRPRSKSSVAVARRGNCTFDMKGVQAEKRGYKALILVNIDETIFPMGTALYGYQSKVPCLLVSSTFWSSLSAVAVQAATSIHTGGLISAEQALAAGEHSSLSEQAERDCVEGNAASSEGRLEDFIQCVSSWAATHTVRTSLSFG